MRERLEELLARQHELGLKRSAAARQEFARVSIAILNLATFGVNPNLSPNWKPVVPPPAKKNLETVADLEAAKSRLAKIKATEGEKAAWSEEYRALDFEVRTFGPGIMERSQREGATA